MPFGLWEKWGDAVAGIAKIAVSAATYAIDKPYDYLIPPKLADALRPGMRAAVPFGAGNRVSDGIVLALGEREDTQKLKYVLALLDEEPMLDPEAIQLALWMREHYFCTVYDAMRVMLPAGLWFSLKDCWRIAPGVDREAAFEAAGESSTAQKLVELLFANGGWAELGKIRMAFGTVNPGPALRELADRNIIVQEASAARGIGDKMEQVATLAMDPSDAMALLASKRRRAPLQYAVGEALCAVGESSTKELCYFTGASMTTVKTLARLGVLTLSKREVYRRPELPVYDRAPPVELNDEQQTAYGGLLALTETGRSAAALLYGVTGSGKTQIYLKLIHSLLEKGKTALVMVPEIALTPQLMRIFASHFGTQVAILHSSLSAGERCDEWKRSRRGEARVVVGTRSAVFAPLPDLGAIILDEEQEPSYKSEQNPRYHARDVARYRCHKSGALLVLGSATPSVDTMYHARQGSYHLFTLQRRFNERALPNVAIVDMKDELRRGNGGCISSVLAQRLEETVDRGEQAILFLNRRGANRMAACVQSAGACSALWGRERRRWRRSCAIFCPVLGCFAWTRTPYLSPTAMRPCWKNSAGSVSQSCWAPRWWQRGWTLRMLPWWGRCRRIRACTPAISTPRNAPFLCSPRWWAGRDGALRREKPSFRPILRTMTSFNMPPGRITTPSMRRKSVSVSCGSCRPATICL